MPAAWLDDPRIDPRLKTLLGSFDLPAGKDAANREELLAEANTAEAKGLRERMEAMMEMADTEEIAPSKGLSIRTERFTSQPDGNTIQVQVIRPDDDQVRPCVYYIHGGGMQSMSCYYGNYRAWGKIIAAQGVVVAMVDFRNALVPSSAPEVAPFPAGLNDCVSGVKWAAENASQLGIDPARIVVAGESGGWQPDAGHRAQAETGRRPRPDQGPLRPVPVHRRRLAAAAESVEHREQRHPARPPQQPRRDGLRHRAAREAQPARLARLRQRRRRERPAADGHQR